MPNLSFVAIGRPQPAGSKKAFVVRRDGRPTGRAAVVDDNRRSKPWQAIVATAALDALDDDAPLLEGPLLLAVDFYFARPKAHYRTGRKAHLVRDGAPAFPAIKPDTTKLLRAVEDALTGVLFRDDGQIVDQVARKRYGTPERAEFRIAEAVVPVVPVGADHDRGPLDQLFDTKEIR